MKKAVILFGIPAIIIVIVVFGGSAFKSGGQGRFLSRTPLATLAEREVSYPQATRELSPGMMILGQCQNMSSICDLSYFKNAAGRNKVVATDFARLYIARQEEGGTVDTKNIFATLNDLYSQITEQEAQEIAELLLLGEAQRKFVSISDADLNKALKQSAGGVDMKMSADASRLQGQQSSGFGSGLDGLLAIKQMIDAGKLTNSDLEKGNNGRQRGSAPKAGSFNAGGGMSFVGGAASCANAAKGKGGLGGSTSRNMGNSGSNGGTAGGGEGGSSYAGDAQGGGGSRKPKENFVRNPGSSEQEEWNKNKDGSGKDAPCQAVNWDALEGDQGGTTLDTPEHEKKAVTLATKEITNSDGETTTVGKKITSYKDENGKEVGKEIKYTVEHPSGDTETHTFNNKSDPTGSKESKFVNEMHEEAGVKGGNSTNLGWEFGKTHTFDKNGKKVGMTDPSAETAKSNLKKCTNSWASAHNSCVMNILLDGFNDKGGLSSCDVLGMPGEEGGGCKKKNYGKEGLNLNLFFGVSSSTGKGVTDPGFN